MRTASRRPLLILGGGLFILLSLLLGFQQQPTFTPPDAFFIESLPLASQSEEPFYHEHFVSDSVTRLVHSATALQRQDGVLQVFWFGGSREGHRDVDIFTAVFDPARQRWSEDAVFMTRGMVKSGELRQVKKLGNPVAAQGPDGRLWLFFVSVSIGGWSGSSVNLTFSDDQGRTWSQPRQLITSPFFNISTLVKGQPFFYTDGSLGLPVYHEFLGKFAEVLRLDADGRVLGKTRLSSGRKAIQPVVYPFDEKTALALMRNTSSATPRRAWASRTNDTGKSWTSLELTQIFNRDSAIAGLVAHDGIFSVVNFSEQDRSGLSLLLSRDQGRTWSFVHDLEPPREPLAPERFAYEVASGIQAEGLTLAEIAMAAVETQCETGRPVCDFRFDYPHLIQDDHGVFHVFYTWNRAFIRHVSFNAAWLEQQQEQPLETLKQREALP